MTMTVWAEGIERGGKLTGGDVKEAIAWYKEKTGREVKLIILNPKNEHLVKEANGIQVEYKMGCLAWEVWLSVEAVQSKSGDPKAQSIESPAEKEKEVLLHTNSDNAQAYQNPTHDPPILNFGGRPPKDIPIQLIHKLRKQGMAIKPIVQELKKQGHSISAMTISRVLSGERTG